MLPMSSQVCSFILFPSSIAAVRIYPYDPFAFSDGWNMIDSMITPYNPEAYDGGGHGYCPFHPPTCNRTEGVAAAALNGTTVNLGSEFETALQVTRSIYAQLGNSLVML
jgi:hypothetical protein